jgi:hypothetical protein
MASRVEADSTTGDIDRPSRSRIQEATPTDELPFQFQLQVISAVLATFSADGVAPVYRLSAKLRGIHDLLSYLYVAEYIMRRPTSKQQSCWYFGYFGYLRFYAFG